jgi:hypothetical protein
MVTCLARFVKANPIGLNNLGIKMPLGKKQLDILEPAFRKNHNLHSLSIRGAIASDANAGRLARMISRLPLRRLEHSEIIRTIYYPYRGSVVIFPKSSAWYPMLFSELIKKKEPHLRVLVITVTTFQDVNKFLDSQAGSQLEQLSVANFKGTIQFEEFKSLLEHTLSHPTLKEVEIKSATIRNILSILKQIERVDRPPLRITLSNSHYPTLQENQEIQKLREKNIFVSAFM